MRLYSKKENSYGLGVYLGGGTLVLCVSRSRAGPPMRARDREAERDLGPKGLPSDVGLIQWSTSRLRRGYLAAAEIGWGSDSIRSSALPLSCHVVPRYKTKQQLSQTLLAGKWWAPQAELSHGKNTFLLRSYLCCLSNQNGVSECLPSSSKRSQLLSTPHMQVRLCVIADSSGGLLGLPTLPREDLSISGQEGLPTPG